MPGLALERVRIVLRVVLAGVASRTGRRQRRGLAALGMWHGRKRLSCTRASATACAAADCRGSPTPVAVGKAMQAVCRCVDG